MRKEIDKMEDHIILCGFGRVGRGVWRELVDVQKVDCVVIEHEADALEDARKEGVAYVPGDATLDESLIAAGIDRAKSLIACVRNDADNLVIVLSAKARRPDLFVVSRATDYHSEPKLRLAGADRVVAPQAVGALRLDTLATGQVVADYLDLVVQGQLLEFQVERFVVSPASPAVGQSLRDANIGHRTGTLVLAVEEIDGRVLVNPGAEHVLRAGQTVYGVGTEAQVDSFRVLIEHAG